MSTILEDCNFETTIHLNTSREQLQDAILNFRYSLSQHDTGLLFFAGHGVEIEGRQYLVPSDCSTTENENFFSDLVDTTNLINEFSSSDNFTGIILLDCCREKLEYTTRTRGMIHNDIYKSKGAYIAFATGPNQPAHERDIDGHGTFTYYLGETIKAYGTERIESVLKRVRKKVIEQHNDQIPWDYSSLMEDFYFKIRGKEEKSSVSNFFNSLIEELIQKNLAYSKLIDEIEERLIQSPDIFKDIELKKQDLIIHILNELDQYFIKLNR